MAAVGRPVVFCGDANGEMAALVSQHRCGGAVSMGDGKALADAIRQLAADPGACTAFGRNARTMIALHYSRAAALSQWRQLIARIGPAVQFRGDAVDAAIGEVVVDLPQLVESDVHGDRMFG